ncbi:MAG TPA: ElyC/SanA/YdcF family protein, partial [Polyangiaceae bacterium]
MKPTRRAFARYGLFLGAVVGSAWVIEVLRMPARSRGLLHDDPQGIAPNRVGLVLGCVPRMPDGRPNLYFTYRIEAASRLYRAGKVEYLLVSGDAARDGQDEPAAMRTALLASGVPDAKIVVDPKGLRTRESILRAKWVYGLGQFTLISQRFHNERAAYIARSMGLSVIGLNAVDPRVSFDKM